MNYSSVNDSRAQYALRTLWAHFSTTAGGQRGANHYPIGNADNAVLNCLPSVIKLSVSYR